jgi:2-methylisocitrate lyase-like PEP mutase family enzyme
MVSHSSAGRRFRQALEDERPLQVVGAINAYAARLAEAVGFRALYLSGGGVAANSLGVPDLGISNPEDVLTDIRRITDAVGAPLLVDADTGWGGAFNIARTVRSSSRRARPDSISRTRSRASAAVTGRARRSCRRRRWSIASRPRWTPGAMRSS